MTQHTPLSCINCGMPLYKDGGCYNPYCSDPAEPATKVTRCPHCDDTGDVHGLDGEWRGECVQCKAIAKAGDKT